MDYFRYGKELTWEPIPDYGDLMTKEDFIDAINSKCLIDYDGIGAYSNGIRMTNIEVWPSLVKKEGWNSRFTHIVWFNK